MGRHANHRPGRRLAQMARWLGFDRNPLRRGTDRVEALLKLVLVIALVAVIPAGAVAVGRWADQQALLRAQAEQAGDHLVTAVLLQNAPATGPTDPYTSVQNTWVLARWQPPGRPPRTGEVLAAAGTLSGTAIRTWIDSSGAVTAPPMDHRVIIGYVCFAVAAAFILSWAVLLVACGLARKILDRRRLSAWDSEWRASGPQWSGHRS